MIETLASFELQVVITIDFKTIVTDSEGDISSVWINSGQDTHNGSIRIFIDAEITEGDSCWSIIAAGDSHGDLLIETSAVIVSDGDGVGLDQLFICTNSCNGAFIHLEVPVDDLVGRIEDGRKGANIVGSICYKGEGVIVAWIGIREGK